MPLKLITNLVLHTTMIALQYNAGKCHLSLEFYNHPSKPLSAYIDSS